METTVLVENQTRLIVPQVNKQFTQKVIKIALGVFALIGIILGIVFMVDRDVKEGLIIIAISIFANLGLYILIPYALVDNKILFEEDKIALLNKKNKVLKSFKREEIEFIGARRRKLSSKVPVPIPFNDLTESSFGNGEQFILIEKKSNKKIKILNITLRESFQLNYNKAAIDFIKIHYADLIQ